MKYWLIICTLFTCIFANGQHWPRYIFQHDSIYKNAGVKSIQWKEDSTKSGVLYSADLDANGRITKLEHQYDPTIHYGYDNQGKLIEEWDWDGNAAFTYDELGRVLTKTFYSDEQIVVKKVMNTYDPIIVRSEQFEDEKLVARKQWIYETPTTIKEYSIENASTYGSINYKYLNSYNEKGQIIKTTNMTMVGEASYQYLENGLLDTITITHSMDLEEGDPPVIQKLIYTYYQE